MSNLQPRQDKIKAIRKQTPFRDFVMEIASWMPIGLQRNQGFISRYPETRMKNIVSNKSFNEERDTLVHNSDNTLGLFFEDFADLRKSTPFSQTIQQGNNTNTDYADSILNSNNVYLSFGVFESCNDICYSLLVTNCCNNIYNSIQITNNAENVYYSIAIDRSSYIFYSKYILNSHHIYFCTNMIGCSECILCDNLENKTYCIQNKQYTKEEYMIQKKKILDQKNVFSQYPDSKIISKNYNSDNITGNCILFSHNIQNGYFVTRATNGRNLILVTGESKDSNIYDCCDCGINGVDFYGVQGGGTNANNYYCVSQCESCFDIYYSYYLYNCSFCLGCIGLRNKSYCILNKQYTKEERYSKVDEIFSQMDRDGQLGKFFPASMNPFYFNDTTAYLIDNSFNKEEITAAGYLRRDEAIKVDIPADAEIVKSTDLDQFESFDAEGNRTISADILKKVIQDDQGNVYRIIPMEYKFLMKHGLPLPRKHWLERMKQNFKIN